MDFVLGQEAERSECIWQGFAVRSVCAAPCNRSVLRDSDPEAGIAVAEESGHLHSMAYDGKLNWSLNGDSIEAQCIGFTINGHKSHWFSRSTGTKSSLSVANGEDGTLFVQSESVDVRYLSCVDNRVVAGCQNGTVYVWEQGLFGRRISDQNEQGALAKDPKKTALQDRLRKLRER